MLRALIKVGVIGIIVALEQRPPVRRCSPASPKLRTNDMNSYMAQSLHEFHIVAAALMALLAAVSHGQAAQAELTPIPIPSNVLATLRRTHPRLLASAEDFARLKTQVHSDAQLRQWHEQLRGQAQKILTEPPSKYEIPDGLRLLGVSRRVLQRTYTLALLYRLDGDSRYVERTWQELNAAANFNDWNRVISSTPLR
jgi:hypothetical protein